MADRRVNLNLVNPSSGGQFLSINFLKNGFQLGSAGNSLARFPAQLSATGVPTNASGGADGSLAFGFNVPASYSGSWVIKWTGTGGCQIGTDQLITVSSGAGFVVSNSGGVLVVAGTNGRVVFQLNAATAGGWNFKFPITTYTNMGEPILVRTADESAQSTGELFNPDFIAAIRALNPKTLRMMQAEAGGSPYVSLQFTQGRPQNYVTWADVWYPPALYAASDISATGGAYTCSAAPATPGSITQGEMIFGWCTTASIGNDTLNVGGRGAKAIVDLYTSTGIAANRIAANTVVSFTYDSILDKYRLTDLQAISPGLPISVMVALCNEVNCDMHFCLSVLASDADVTAMTTYVRNNLKRNYRVEFGNENWGGAPPDPSQILTGWSHVLFPGNIGVGDPYALRYRQLMGIVTTGWAPRSLSSLSRIMAWQQYGSASGFLTAMQGGNLSSYGFNTSPNRPMDFADSVSYATYINGPNTPAFQGSYLASGQEGLYLAADNYASGDPARMSAALDWVDKDLRISSGNANGSSNLAEAVAQNTTWETAVASYDANRNSLGFAPFTVDCYEGGLQINAPTVATLNGLGLNGALYGGTANGTGYVTGGRIANLFTAYKNDTRCLKLVFDLINQFMALGHSVTPSWFNFVGDFTQWSLYPGDLYSSPFQSYNALVALDKPGAKNVKGNF